MNILFIGDIFGRPGRKTVAKLLQDYRKKLKINVVIANAENMHHGKGVTEPLLKEMRTAGIDFFTSGNHIWKEREIIPKLDDPKLPLIRPANYLRSPGKGYQVIEDDSGKRFSSSTLWGVFSCRCTWTVLSKLRTAFLKKFQDDDSLSAIFVDFPRGNNIKMALAHYLDGRITALIGTHTHVPTFDARILVVALRTRLM
ncbi:MAG: YmdB family metallophosphoesterase [Candidatus Gracilibacteria bacterium]